MVGSSTNPRIQSNDARPVDGKCVLYVMSRDQRVADNHALIAAQQHALEAQLPLAVVFVLRPSAGQRSREHYLWMLHGLRQVERDLARLDIPFMMLIGDPVERLVGCINHLAPAAIYADMNPLHGPQAILRSIEARIVCPLYRVDTHNIVPVWQASDKQEYAARTLRPKIHRHLADYVIEPDVIQRHPHAWPGVVMPISKLQEKIDTVLAGVTSNGQNELQKFYPSGEASAHHALSDFIQNRLKSYATDRNDPSIDGLSRLSPYLHFGQLSSLRVVLEVYRALADDSSLQAGADALIEEMVVRKELSDNFCYYNPAYDRLGGAADWARATLAKHLHDDREFLYTLQQFESAQTHDPAWNAAQLQLVRTGKIHGYMRMYWAKKVLEWSPSADEAIKTLVYLNDFYSIDGGDPNGYVGILWSVAGVHDRPWGERAVYGTIRSMVYGGLKRKFNIQAYIDHYS